MRGVTYYSVRLLAPDFQTAIFGKTLRASWTLPKPWSGEGKRKRVRMSVAVTLDPSREYDARM